jgi:TP901 family phage tail tape measure protein
MAEPSGALLGSAYGYIDLDSSGAINALNQTKREFNNFISSTASVMQGWGNQLAGWGSQLTMWTAPLTAIGAVGLNVASSFDSVLTEIQARTGLTAEAMEQIRQAALDYGAATSFSSQQAADAFLNLLTAGLSTEDALAALGPVLDAAAAGGMDLAQAADYTTSVMAAFNLKAEDATTIVNAMSRASAASPATMNEMGAALQRVGGMATSFGLDVEETSAILAIFAQNGLRGTEAGTALASLLRNMQRDVPGTQAAWDALGTSLYNADGTMRNLDDVFRDIEAGLAGMSDEERNRTIMSLAGAEGMVAFNALLASDGIADMQASMESQASAADVAKQMMNSFAGQVDSLKGSVETLWITVLTPFMNNVLRPLIGMMIGAVNAVTTWAAANEPLVQTIVEMVSVFLALGPAAWGLGEAIKFVGFNLSTIGTIFGFIMSPLGLFIAGASLLAFIFRDQLWAAINSIVGPLQVMFGAIQAGVPILDAFQHFLFRIAGSDVASAFGKLRNIVGGFVTWFTVAWNRLRDGGIAGLWDFIVYSASAIDWVQLGTDVLNGITSGLSIAGSWVYDNLISPLLGAFGAIDWGMVGTAILQGIGLAISLYSSWINFVTDNILTPLFDNAKTALSTIDWQQLGKDIVGFIFGGSSGEAGGVDWGAVFGGWMDAITNFGSTAFDFLGWCFDNVISPLWQGIMDGLGNVDWGQVWTTFLDLSGQALNALWTGATWVWDNLISPMINLIGGALAQVDWVAVGTTLMDLFGAALNALWVGATWVWDNLISPMITAVGGALAQVDWMQLGTDILNSLGNVFLTLLDWGTWVYDNWLVPLVNAGKQAVENFDWFEFGKQMIENIGAALKATFDFVAWIIDSIFNPVKDNAKHATDQLDWFSIGQGVLNAIGQSLINTFNFIIWLKDNVFGPLLSGAGKAIQEINWSSVGQNLMDAIKNALPNIIQWVTDNIITPIKNALAGFNPMAGINTTTQLGGGGYQAHLQSTVSNAAAGVMGQIGGFASGIDFVPSDMIALIHEGERVQRANENPYNPNAQTNGMGGGEFNFYGDINVNGARSYNEALEVGRGVADGIRERLRQKGGGRA